MVTARTYWSLAEAVLEKSLLDDYEIFCALIDENVHLYGGAPFAMPVRLQVREDQAEQATAILSGDPGRAAEINMLSAASVPPDSMVPEIGGSNPWELLAIALYFLLPGICFLQTEYPATARNTIALRRGIAAVDVAHLLGWLAVIFAAVLLALYYYASRREAGTTNSDDGDSVPHAGAPNR